MRTTVIDLEASEHPVQVRLLGPFEFSGPDGRIDVGGKKLRAMVAYLAFTSPRAARREHVTQLLWGSHFETQARQNLRQALVRIKKSLGSLISTDDEDTITLDVRQIAVDAHRFEALINAGTPESQREAIGLYRGPFLEHAEIGETTFDAWLLAERRRLDELAVDAHVAVANLLVDRGQVAEAINLARRGTLIVPLREDCHRTLMLALAAAGKRGEALRHFADFDGGLNAELQASPEPETMALAEMLRQEHQSSTRPAHVPATISPNIADMIGDGNGLAANSAVAAPLGETGVLVRPTDPETPQVPARPEHSARAWILSGARPSRLLQLVGTAVGAAALGSLLTALLLYGANPNANTTRQSLQELGGAALETAIPNVNIEGIAVLSGDPYILRFAGDGEVQVEMLGLTAELTPVSTFTETGRWWVEQDALMVKFVGWSQGRNIRRWILRDTRGLWAEFPGRSSSSEFVYTRAREVKWGALAYGANGVHGRSWHKASKEEAEVGALKDCARHGRCEVTSFSGDGCAALASHKEAAVAVEKIAVNANSIAARLIARRQCEAQSSGAPCRIVALVCADGRHQTLR